MTGIATSFAPQDVASLLAWWRDAGVESLTDDRPMAWLAPPRQPSAAASRTSPVQTDRAASSPLPDTIEAFLAWIGSSADIPEAPPPAQRIAASGPPGSRLMIMVDMPALGDVEAGRVLATETGDMFDRMLSSIGYDRSNCYIATLCPGRVPTGRLQAESLARLGEIGRRHIALAGPEQVWLMGDAVSRAILGMELLEARGRLHRIKDVSETIGAVVSFSPLFLHRSPRRKADAWADMQMLRRGNEA
jgi:DNA polymerase